MRPAKTNRSAARHRQVVYDPKVFRHIVDQLHKAYPNEFGGFLFAETHFLRSETFVINGCSFGEVGTSNKWTFEPIDVINAHRLAADQSLRLAGYFHSHPWKNPPYSMIVQSSADADLQDDYDLSLSLVVGICPTYWISATWRRGYTAPYPQIIGNQLVHNWCKTNSNDELLATHYYVVT